MTAYAQRLRLRLFIEGVEVPVIGATVESRPNSPIVSSIQIPPLAEGTRLSPRSLIHLFFLDFYAAEGPFPPSKAGNSQSSNDANPSAYEQGLMTAQQELIEFNDDITVDLNASNQQYKLLFVGEFVGFNWTKNSSQRSLVLQCMDLSNYWDYAYQWNNTDLFGPGIKALFSGGSTNLFTDFLEDEGGVIVKLVKQRSRNYPELKGLLGGVVNLLEAIGGTYYTDKKVGGENIFFSLAELRLHITQMITAYEKDPTSANLFNAGGYGDLLGRTLGNLGNQVSFRSAINALMGAIFHETFAIPTPLYVPGSYGTVSGQVRAQAKDNPETAFVSTNGQKLVTGLGNIIDNVNTSFAANAETNFALIKGTVISQLDRSVSFSNTTINQISASGIKELANAKNFFATANTLMKQAKTKLNAQWTGRPLPPRKLADAVVDLLTQAKKQFERATDYSFALNQKSKSIPARLNQQIFRPDVWFSAPPRCNVIFPDQYSSLNYARMFLDEPTRFMLKTNDEFFGEDELFDNFYFAPKAFTVKQNRNSLQAVLSNDLLDHELFTGILPVFEKMGELNIFGGQSGTEKGKPMKVGLAQRSTNFLYFKHRFAARRMSVEGNFNPYVVPGFPGLFIDKPVDLGTLQRHNELLARQGKTTRELDKLLGTHFLANLTNVTHVVDQRQGKTVYECGYARQPEESVEFLGAIESQQTVQKRASEDANRHSIVAALNPPPPGSLGPSKGVVKTVLDITNAYRAQSAESGPFFTLFRGPRQGTSASNIKVPVGITLQAIDYGSEVADFIGNGTAPVTFRLFDVEEEVPRYRKETIDLPAEEYIRPGWYGPVWKPSNVGKVYDAFFQTGAITDQQQIGDSQGASLGASGADDNQNSTQGSPFQDPAFGEFTSTVPIVLGLDPGSSIAQAVQFLVLTYSYIKQAGDISTNEFIKAYTWRPVASIVDMFGTSDLTLSPDGSQVLRGFEGFHSRAFGQYNDLFGLVTPDIENVLGIKRGATAAQKADTRKRKQDLVLDYMTGLNTSRAIIG